ncbi:hypothetical protein ACFRAQ_23195 [Nocardia sp. NPDC056611]|uniref:hypothetical protein n=1 Tax=Nocardia sp. NPDC056611 TaxID=3345877 RepID=UPI00366CDAA0
MSHQLATQAARSTRRTAQVIRYSAIVTASMASIGLTVAAGSYIANEMAQRPGKLTTTTPAGRPALAAPGPATDRPGVQLGAPIAEKITLTSLFSGYPLDPAVAQAIPDHIPGSAPAAEAPRPLAGQLRLGTTYVGAQLAGAQHETVTLTLDTNVFATVADVLLNSPLGQQLGITTDPTANTRLRTDVDSRGDVTLTLSDPALGTYGLQIARHPVPAAAATNVVHGEDSATVTV